MADDLKMTMNGAAREAVKQVPGLAVMGIIVWLFLQFMEGQATLLSNISKEHFQNQKLVETALNRNTEALGRIEHVLDEYARRPVR